MQIQVLVVDDHPVLRQGIRALLDRQEDIRVCAEASSAEEALVLVRALHPNVILMDLQLPGKSGLEAMKEILVEAPESRILVLSNFTDDKNILAAIEAGASGYLLKVDAADKIIQAVRDTFLGSPIFSRQAESTLMAYIRGHKASGRGQGPKFEQELSEREMAILKMMARGLSNEEMAAQAFISQGTVRTHVSNILRKLNLENRAQAILYALKQGWVNLDEIDHI